MFVKGMPYCELLATQFVSFLFFYFLFLSDSEGIRTYGHLFFVLRKQTVTEVRKCPGLFDEKSTRIQRWWFKQHKGLPHKGYLPSHGGMPAWMASEDDCVERWGSRKKEVGYYVPKNYVEYGRLKKRYEQVHQKPMGNTVPFYFALGWVAEEKFGEDAVDWATFACWMAGNCDGHFTEPGEEKIRVPTPEKTTVVAEKSNAIRQLQNQICRKDTAQTSVNENTVLKEQRSDASSEGDVRMGGPEVWQWTEAWHGKKSKVPVRAWSTRRSAPVQVNSTVGGHHSLPRQKRGRHGIVSGGRERTGYEKEVNREFLVNDHREYKGWAFT